MEDLRLDLHVLRAVVYWGIEGLSLQRSNPYGGLLADAMTGLGAELVAGYDSELNEGWLLENQGRVDVLHLHWPHYMYNALDLDDCVSRCSGLIEQLARARSLGYKIVWTVHNLYPHESGHFELHRLARIAITHLATALIVHCERARALVQAHFFRRNGVFTIPHGHFIDAYPNTMSRAEARRRLGLSEAQFVYHFFGNIRPYKGLENLLQVFADLPGDDLVLLMAAKVYDHYSETLVERARQDDARIVIRTERFFANEDFQLYLNAADVVVLPFLNILTSGSAITAMSFGRPVIVPRAGCLPELVDDSMAFLYDPQQSDELKAAMVDAQTHDLVAAGRAAYRRATSLSWDSIARLTLEAYRY